VRISKGFPHFDAQTVASQGNAILGIRDSGKSFTAIKIAEMFFDAGIPFIAFDPIGRWRFMRVPGAGRGYPVVVAGGRTGDLKLTVQSAPKIVNAALAAGVSVIIDLYDIEISKADWKRIVGDSVREMLYHNDSLRHVFIEEAAEFVPQRVGPSQGVVYAEVEKLGRMGGNARLGYTLVNQRAEEVNKAVLELCDNLYLHRQKGRNSLNALTKWLNLADVKPGSREIIKSLPTLPQGECWAWMGGTDKPVKIKVPLINSFVPDRRRMLGTATEVTKHAVDVDSFVAELRSRLEGKTLPKPRENHDVKESEARALRDENTELKRQISELRQALAPPNAAGNGDLAAMRSEAARTVRHLPEQGAVSVDDIIAELVQRAEKDPAILRLLKLVPEIEVTIKRQVIELNESTLVGRVAGLIAEGFFDTSSTANAAFAELKRRGFACAVPSVYRACDDLTLKGFLRKGDGYTAVPGMKINIKEAA
jgi:hypothetical protein